MLPPDARQVTRLTNPMGTEVPLHNADTRDDARRLATLVGESPEVVVIGLYPVELLDELLAVRGRRVLVLEPDSAWAEHLQTSTRRRGVEDAGRFAVTALADGEEPIRQHFAGSSGTPVVLLHPVLRKVWPEAVNAAQQVVQRAFSGASANLEARRLLAPHYLSHTLANLPRIARGADVTTLVGGWQGRPALLLGAGPSLDTALAWLRAEPTAALVIATDTALRPCLAAGVEPDICVAVDPSPANGRHMSDLVVPARTWLCAEGSLLPEAMAPFGERVIIFRVADHDPWPWLDDVGLRRGKLRAWGSVLTTAFDLALTMGASPIVFAGADLAYTGGRPYCSGTTYERDWAALRADGVTQEAIARSFIRQPVDVMDVNGHPTVSAPHLLEFRDWILEHASRLEPGRVINATAAGILHGPGIRQASLDGALRGHSRPVGTLAAVLSPHDNAAEVVHLHDAVRHVLWGLRTGDGATAELVSRWQAFTSGQVGLSAITDGLVDVARRGRLSRLPVVERREDAPMAQDDEELLQAFEWIRGLGDVHVYVEIGSRFGGSLYAMARHLGPEATCIAIDLPNGPWGHPDGAATLARVAADLRVEGYDVHVIAGDSHDPAIRRTLAEVLERRGIDVLLLDGDRTTAGILKDAEEYGAFVRPGGLLLLHDIAAEPGLRGRSRAELPVSSCEVLDAGAAAWAVLSDGRRAACALHAYGLGGLRW